MEAFVLALKEISCYELLPTHGKVVALDADLPMKHALAALSSHTATCLPVWDSTQQCFVDIFTCSDLVDVVMYTHRALSASGVSQPSAPIGTAQQQIEACQLRDLHGLKRSKPAGFVMASVDDSLYHGCLVLKQHGLECLPLGESASSATSLLHMLLPEQLLAFIVASPDLKRAAPEIFSASLHVAMLPRCVAPTTVRLSASLSEALTLLSEQRVPALAVLDNAGALVDVLTNSDVRHLASSSHTDDLTTHVDEALRSLPRPTVPRLHTCRPSDTLGSAVQRLALTEAAQLVCVTAAGAVCAVITSLDVLTCFLLE